MAGGIAQVCSLASRGLESQIRPMILTRIAFAAALTVATVLRAAAQSAPSPLDTMFERRELKIPMRDGVGLFTVILTPKRAAQPLPFLMSRTPYGTGGWGGTR